MYKFPKISLTTSGPHATMQESPTENSVRMTYVVRQKPKHLCVNVRNAASFFAVMVSVVLAGCSSLRPKPADKYVYVIAKQTFLRDRVAAVSNRTGNVLNGERLVVLERSRRFIKVRTPDGAVGWIEEKLTADQALADKFDQLREQHEKDSTVAAATARDEVYLHIAPGRETDRFFRLAEGDKLSLLSRATVPKPVTPGATPALSKLSSPSKANDKDKTEAVGPPPPVMEDWWLVRDTHNQTGWIYGRMIDVDAPDAISRYAEGQRIVGAYVLTKVEDSESGVLSNGQMITTIPEYVTFLSPYQAGLAYDFDQVRVFIWNTKKHRYETAYRQRNIAGYLPVQLSQKTDPGNHSPLGAMALPAFSFRVLAADAPLPVPDPKTGAVKPAKTILKTYRLEGNQCRRILAPGEIPQEEAHPIPETEKKNGKRHRR